MEILINYLDAMFAAYPDTEATRTAKGELLINMEDRYKELLQNGKSQNEAVGEVISQFGNIEELMDSLNVQRVEAVEEDEDEGEPVADDAEVTSYLDTVQASSRKTALGVLLCILVPAACVYGVAIGKVYIAIVSMFVLIAGAVGLFVSGYYALKPFGAKKAYPKRLSARMTQVVSAQQKNFQKTHSMWMCVGICLCVLCPIPTILNHLFRSMELSVVTFFLMIAVGVFCIVRVTLISTAFKKLLRQEKYNITRKQLDLEKAVDSVLWPIATGLFFVLGFVYKAWGTAWVVFPIAGILQDVLVKQAKKKKKA